MNTQPSTSAALEKNVNPLDKEDPLRATTALPFPNADGAEIREEVITNPKDDDYYYTSNIVDHPPPLHHQPIHNGNILDRTMDNIRAWVHGFQQKSHGVLDEGVLADRKVDSSTIINNNTAKGKMTELSNQASSTVHQMSDKAASLTSTVRQQASDAVHIVSDKASATVHQVKQKVEPLTTSAYQTVSQKLPSKQAVKAQVKSMIPPLVQQASSTSAFLGSFATQYLSTYKEFLLSLRKQSLPLQLMTGLLFVSHFVLPLFFFDKGPARSVLYCYILSTILSHVTFFLSGHLRYLFLAHLVFIPMIISLTLHAGFGEAATANQVSAELGDGNKLKAMLIAPLSLRNYLFVLWLRIVLMVQAALLTLDVVNVLDMLGFSLETRRGQEMMLINRRVQQMRKSFIHSIQTQPTTAQGKSSSSSSSISSSSTSTKTSSQSDPSKFNDEGVFVQSHEQEGMRQRKRQGEEIHPKYSINNQPL
jgi:hypothetical protein